MFEQILMIYLAAGIVAAAFIWGVVLSYKEHGWFYWLRTTPNTRRILYGKKTDLALWIEEILWLLFFTACFIALWWAVLPAILRGRK